MVSSRRKGTTLIKAVRCFSSRNPVPFWPSVDKGIDLQFQRTRKKVLNKTGPLFWGPIKTNMYFGFKLNT